MLKIGFSRQDPESRKFYFDDSQVLTSNPPKYKIWYVDDETDIDYIECSKVFYLKPAKIERNKPKPVVKKEEPQQPITSEPIVIETKPETPKKKPGRKKKVSTSTDILPTPTPSMDILPTPTTSVIFDKNITYEYKVIDESFENTEDLQDTLNGLGEDGWELCGFETYRTNLFNKPTSAVCVLRRRK